MKQSKAFYMKTTLKIALLLVFLLVVGFLVNLFWPLQASKSPSQASLTKIPNAITVSVYYEALCPDSKSFIRSQLLPTHNKASRLFRVDLVPYGKADTAFVDGRYEFECQHGKPECEANIMHSCAVKLIADATLLIDYVSCMIADNMDADYAARMCANQLGVDYAEIKKCARGDEGRLLLKQNGEKTKTLSPPLDFVPTVTFNHYYNNTLLFKGMLKDLHAELCRQFAEPLPECDQ